MKTRVIGNRIQLLVQQDIAKSMMLILEITSQPNHSRAFFEKMVQMLSTHIASVQIPESANVVVQSHLTTTNHVAGNVI